MEREFSAVSTPELVEQITTLAGHLNAANARFLALVAEFDRRGGWAEWGVKSCAHWLNWKCGIGLGAAREKVRVAHALEKLPRIAAAMSEGRLSYAKARELTRVAEAGNEDYLHSDDGGHPLDRRSARPRRGRKLTDGTTDEMRSRGNVRRRAPEFLAAGCAPPTHEARFRGPILRAHRPRPSPACPLPRTRR